MEAATEEQINMARGKRSKRQRPSSPFAHSTSSTSACLAANCGSIPTSSEEEEDMANCLILLAQGASAAAAKDSQIMGGKAAGGFECKTCNRSFPSFQALGGHRASHKKNKIDEKNKADDTTTSSGGSRGTEIEENQEARVNLNHHLHHQSHHTHNNDRLLTLPIFPVHHNTHKPSSSSKPGIAKVHECSICGSEFISGQALGGHMRRHRPPVTAVVATAATGSGELKHAMTLDLNLPPPVPEDDRLDSKFHEFASREQRNLVFSSPAPLVDCHY